MLRLFFLAIQLTTQSVYRVQLPNSRSGYTLPIGSQLNLPADLLLRGPPPNRSPTGRSFLVLGLFVAGFDRQAPEPGHRCAPPTATPNANSPHQVPMRAHPYPLHHSLQHQQTGPICQVGLLITFDLFHDALMPSCVRIRFNYHLFYRTWSN